MLPFCFSLRALALILRRAFVCFHNRLVSRPEPHALPLLKCRVQNPGRPRSSRQHACSVSRWPACLAARAAGGQACGRPGLPLWAQQGEGQLVHQLAILEGRLPQPPLLHKALLAQQRLRACAGDENQREGWWGWGWGRGWGVGGGGCRRARGRVREGAGGQWRDERRGGLGGAPTVGVRRGRPGICVRMQNWRDACLWALGAGLGASTFRQGSSRWGEAAKAARTQREPEGTHPPPLGSAPSFQAKQWAKMRWRCGWAVKPWLTTAATASEAMPRRQCRRPSQKPSSAAVEAGRMAGGRGSWQVAESAEEVVALRRGTPAQPAGAQPCCRSDRAGPWRHRLGRLWQCVA